MSDPSPFDRYESGGKALLGIPAGRDGTARHGYGPPVFAQCGYQCAYCGFDMGSPYEAWLDLSVDHVVPQHLTKSGWKAEWVLDLINLVTCCRACNEFLNGYRVSPTSPPQSLEEFLARRDSAYSEKLHRAQSRHAIERQRYAAARPAGPSEAQEELRKRTEYVDPLGPVNHVERRAGRTQRITASDISTGQIRVPHETKELLPGERTYLDVDMLGTRLRSRWDPRYGPDQERSGIIRIGRARMAQLGLEDEVLEVWTTAEGIAIRRAST